MIENRKRAVWIAFGCIIISIAIYLYLMPQPYVCSTWGACMFIFWGIATFMVIIGIVCIIGPIKSIIEERRFE